MGDAQIHASPAGPETIPPIHEGLQYDPPARPLCSALSPPERLVLWTVRALAESQNNWTLVQREFWLRCGPATIEDVLGGLTGLLTTLAQHCRRPLCMRKVASPRLSADEVSLLTLVAAAQRGQSFRMMALVRWLVAVDGQDALAAHTLAFAAGLLQSGVSLAPADDERD